MRSPTVVIALGFILILRCCSSLDFKWKYLNSEDAFEIEISTPYTGDVGEKYIAVAFAKEPIMKNGDGYYCTSTEVKSIVLRERYDEPTLLNDLQGVKLSNLSTVNGNLTCTFTRPMRVTKTISNGEEYTFSFDLESYYVLMAYGDLSGESLTYHTTRDTKEIVDFASAITDVINPIDGSICGTDGKICTEIPLNCRPSDVDCMFFSIKQEGNRITMEISGGKGNGEAYVAVAFGDGKKMENADLYYCDGNRLQSGVIRQWTARPIDLDDKSVQVISAGTINGVGQCIFSRAVCVTKEISYGIPKQFDFIANMYFVLLARGNMTIDGQMLQHTAQDRLTTPSAVPLARSTGEEYQCEEVDLSPGGYFNDSDCETSYCMEYPENCRTSSPDCMFVALKLEENSFRIQMSGGTGEGEEFIAVNFVPRNNTNAEMYYCDGQTVKTAILDGEGVPIQYGGQTGLTNIQSGTTNGVGHCSFIRPGCMARKVSNGIDHLYNLFISEYQLQIVKGSINSSDGIQYNMKDVVAFAFMAQNTTLEELPAERYECVNGYESDQTTKSPSSGKAIVGSINTMILVLVSTLCSGY